MSEKLSAASFQAQLDALLRADQIVLFGAGELASFAMLRLDYLGRRERVVAIVDNDPGKLGRVLDGVRVVAPSELKGHERAKVIVTVGNEAHQEEIKLQLMNLGFTDVVSNRVLLEPYQFTGKREPYLARHNNRTILKSVVLSITEKCTLRCKHCSYLTTHIRDPRHTDKDVVIRSARALSDTVDVVNTCALVGGEPFLHPDLDEICDEVGRIENFRFKNLITNATVVPREGTLEILARRGIAVFFSDYGALSRKRIELERLCEKHGVLFRQAFNGNEDALPHWFSTSLPEPSNRSPDEDSERYAKCWPCNAVVNGEFWVCVWEAFGVRIGRIPKASGDHVDLLAPGIARVQVRASLEELLTRRSVPVGCHYCSESEVVPIAEQV